MAQIIFTRSTSTTRVSIEFGSRQWSGNPDNIELYREGSHLTVMQLVPIQDHTGRATFALQKRFTKDDVDWATSDVAVAPTTDKEAFEKLRDEIFSYAGGLTG